MNIVKIDLNTDYSDVIAEAVSILKMGGVIVYPTDTVYGIGGNALDELVVRQVFEIKGRSSKPFPILAKNMTWVEELVHILPKHRKLTEKLWPGKFTLIFPKKDIVPPIVTTGLPNLGIRIADHPFVDKLLGKFGYPLIGTSANLSGEKATGDISEVIAAFANSPRRPDLIIDAGVLPPSNPSVVVDCTVDKPRVLRVGPTKPDEFLKLLDL